MRTFGLKITVSPGTLVLATTEVAVFVTILMNGVSLLSATGHGLLFDWGNVVLIAIAAGLFILAMWSLGAYDRRFATSLIRNRGRLLTASAVVSLAFWLVASGHLGALEGPKPSLVTSCVV